MRPIHRLIDQLAAAEAALETTAFLAPCVRGGRVRARVAGLVRLYAPKPRDFEGWGLFRPVDERRAEVVEEADLPQVGEYLRLLKPLRVRLAHVLAGRAWLAYPANESDARQRFGAARPMVVQLVSEGSAFEQGVVRRDGAAWWFEEPDRRADPADADCLREALRQVTPAAELRFPGLTPEMRAAYDLGCQQAREFAARRREQEDERRLREALRLAGGELREFHERGRHWLVQWTTRDGERHTSAIDRRDLTVVSSGICLSGRDREFDLQSLVGVMEGQWGG